ncbi:MAG: alpha/beta hydrolase, partial [Ilumatobacter sp.]
MSTPADDTDRSVDDAVDGEPPAPELPPATPVELAGLGEVDVREVPGPEGAPAVILIHGWTASADINFFTCYQALGEHVRVIAFDQRGHGSGLRTRRVVRLEDCADDVARVADALGIDTFIPVGYSMGGTIAQLTWRRHRDRVDGLVLAATAPHFAERRDERLSFLGLTGLAALARVTPTQARDRISDQVYLRRKTETWGPWAVAQAARHDWRMVLEAGRALGNFSSTDWLGEIDVPTSVLVTMRDPVVPLRRQVRLFDEIPGAEAFRVDGEHDAVVANADRFVPTLIRAIGSVTSRIVSAG